MTNREDLGKSDDMFRQYQSHVATALRLLQCSRGPRDAQRDFNLWVETTADWLKGGAPDTGIAAQWIGLSVTNLWNDVYRCDPEFGRNTDWDQPVSAADWKEFHESVRKRVEWLGKFGDQLRRSQSAEGKSASPITIGSKVFVVHGHNEAAKDSVARFLAKLKLDPAILHEQANAGRTIPCLRRAWKGFRFSGCASFPAPGVYSVPAFCARVVACAVGREPVSPGV